MSGARRGGKGRVICWDLDETIGIFRDYGDMRIMRGIGPLLDRLSAEGATHVITTGAITEHAEYVLCSFSLRQHFDGIFARDRICDQDYNKYYHPVAEALGIPADEAGHRMLVIGNLARDSPADLDLVFFFHPLGFRYDQTIPESVLSMLSSHPDSWSAAYDLALMGAGSQIEDPGFLGKWIDGNGLQLALGRAIIPGKPQPSGGNRVITYHSLPGDRLVYPDYPLEQAA